MPLSLKRCSDDGPRSGGLANVPTVNPPDNAIARQESSVEIAASPEAVYDLVADLTRMGEWSPESTGGAWKDGGTGKVGDWFEGHNRSGEREWTRDCEVVVADRGREFTFVVGGVEKSYTWWCYEMAPSAAGTTLQEKWWIVNKSPALQEMSEERFQARVAYTKQSIVATLAAVKATAES